MVHFLYPNMFWIFGIPFLIFVVLLLTNKDKLDRIFTKDILSKIEVNDNYLPPRVRNIIFITSLFLMIIALSRPVSNEKELNITQAGINAVVAIDISGSMRSEDNYPNRLEFAKQKIKKLIEFMSNDEISLIAFAGNAFMVSPYTNDTFALVDMLDGINSNMITDMATNYDDLADVLVDLTKKQKEKIAIVVSDGGDEKELDTFRKKILSENIKLYVILVGTESGAVVLDKNGKPRMLSSGVAAVTKQNESLGKIALESGGAYIKASYGDKDTAGLAHVVHNINSQSYSHSSQRIQRDELFYVPLAFSIFLLLLSLISIPSKRI